MNFSTRVRLENEMAVLEPLEESDFDRLYSVASDPAVWANHPNKNRCERDVFQNFFKGAVESGGAYLICDKKPERSSAEHDFTVMTKTGTAY